MPLAIALCDSTLLPTVPKNQFVAARKPLFHVTCAPRLPTYPGRSVPKSHGTDGDLQRNSDDNAVSRERLHALPRPQAYKLLYFGLGFLTACLFSLGVVSKLGMSCTGVRSCLCRGSFDNICPEADNVCASAPSVYVPPRAK